MAWTGAAHEMDETTVAVVDEAALAAGATLALATAEADGAATLAAEQPASTRPTKAMTHIRMDQMISPAPKSVVSAVYGSVQDSLDSGADRLYERRTGGVSWITECACLSRTIIRRSGRTSAI
jgi:hypothetical protein